MLPRIDVLDLCTLNSASTVGLIEDCVRLSTDRLNDPEVANVRSITVPIATRAVSDLGSDKHECKTDQFWSDCCVNALRILVPEVKFITRTATAASCSEELPHHSDNFHHPPGYYACHSLLNAAAFGTKEAMDLGAAEEGLSTSFSKHRGHARKWISHNYRG